MFIIRSRPIHIIDKRFTIRSIGAFVFFNLFHFLWCLIFFFYYFSDEKNLRLLNILFAARLTNITVMDSSKEKKKRSYPKLLFLLETTI